MRFGDEDRITHALEEHYQSLRRIRTRRALERSALWAEIGPELARILGAVERGRYVTEPSSPERARGPAARPISLRVAAWNINRGTHLEALVEQLRSDATLARADVLLLSEVDLGMARSGNRNVAREIASALGMSYAFGVSYLVLEDDVGENPDGVENREALAGCAILSRWPLGRVVNVDLPELRDKFSSAEKRLGKKRALVAELAEPFPVTLAACHLDSNASPTQRALQLESILAAAHALGPRPLILGGDLNTSTYDASSGLALARDLLHKFFVTGFHRTIAGYMSPERHREQPLFETLARHGLRIEGFNDRSTGTLVYDLNEGYAVARTERYVGVFLRWLLQRALRPYGGAVPARLDWFAARDLAPLACATIRPVSVAGVPVSDHSAIFVELEPTSSPSEAPSAAP